jgi:Holliday junction DNA helicase RuvA
MFNSIRGIISEKLADTLRIVTGGIEWELSVPAADMEGLPPQGEEARIFTWFYHREDAMRVFGFADERRRATFLELLKVEGIGPAKAVQILGRIREEDLERALEAGDIARLEAVPGLGKKTAQKMILALKGKLVHPPERKETAAPYGDLAEALAEMGYDRRAASEALNRAGQDLPPGLSESEKEKFLFKQAIVYLSGL